MNKIVALCKTPSTGPAVTGLKSGIVLVLAEGLSNVWDSMRQSLSHFHFALQRYSSVKGTNSHHSASMRMAAGSLPPGISVLVKSLQVWPSGYCSFPLKRECTIVLHRRPRQYVSNQSISRTMGINLGMGSFLNRSVTRPRLVDSQEAGHHCFGCSNSDSKQAVDRPAGFGIDHVAVLFAFNPHITFVTA